MNRIAQSSMGSWIKTLTFSALALTFQLASAGTITGSAHDFSSDSWSGGQICVACHAPHNTSTAVTAAPLWNHALSTQTYTLYSTSTLNSTPGQPAGVSKLCLSCHDGTVAVNSFGGATGSTFVTGNENLGIDLSNDHPIGITYDAALVTADGALNPTSTAVTIGSGGKTRVGTIATNMLYAGKLECSSCHDVHNTFTAASTKLLKVTSAASALCTTCHSK